MDIVKEIKHKSFSACDLLNNVGGEWLGRARSWIQWNAYNGDQVDWGSETQLNLKYLTVGDIERFAADIAYATLKQHERHLVTEGQRRALDIYENPDNWSSSFGDHNKCLLDIDRDHVHYAMSFMHKDGWDLSTCVDDPETAKKNKWGNVE